MISGFAVLAGCQTAPHGTSSGQVDARPHERTIPTFRERGRDIMLLRNAKGNNGIKFWVTEIKDAKGKGAWLGIEYQMIDDDGHPDGLRGGSHNTGSIYDIVDSAKDKAKKPIGEWNQSRIVVKDGKIEHYLNGKLSSSADTKSEEWKAAIAKSKFKNNKGFGPGHGKLMLTEHGDPCWFRNIVVTEL